MSIEVTRHIEFEAAHMLYKYEGLCKNLHGHSYKLEVTIKGTPNEQYGFVMDFKKLNAIMKEIVPDHMFISNKTLPDNSTERQIVKILKKADMAIMEYDFVPSAENMVSNFAKQIQERLPEGLTVTRACLWETTNSFATWNKE